MPLSLAPGGAGRQTLTWTPTRDICLFHAAQVLSTYSQPASRAMRIASMRLRALTLAIAFDR